LKRAALFAAIVVLGWTAWDTGADPVRFVRGLPWIADFLRRMLPPDLRVLPAALLGAITTLEIALLGTAVAALLALPLGFLSARNVAAPAVFHPARATLNFFRSVDTLVYALIFVAAVGLGPFPGVLAVVAYTTTSLAKLYSEAIPIGLEFASCGDCAASRNAAATHPVPNNREDSQREVPAGGQPQQYLVLCARSHTGPRSEIKVQDCL